MSIHELIPDLELTETEQNLLAEHLSHPTFKRYLQILANNDLKELALLQVTERDDAVVGKKHALIQGKLSVLSTLMSVKKPTNQSKE